MPATDDPSEMPIPFGISADTGLPLDGLDAAALDHFRSGGAAEAVSPETLAAKADSAEAHFGTIGDVDPNDLSQAGWGVLFGPSVDQRIKDALQPLLDHRKAQAADDSLFKVFDGPSGFLPGDTAQTWLQRQGVRIDVVDPQLGVPFYMLIAAAPDEVPFEFQYVLDLYWAVGRVWFTTPDEFRQYADSVVRYETMPKPSTTRQVAVFATRHDGDAATQMFSDQVAMPIVNGSGPTAPLGQRQKFTLRPFLGDSAQGAATKDTLGNIFKGSIAGGPPALLFSGSHGVSFPNGDPHQEDSQGALLCQDWAGAGAVVPNDYFNASDLPANAKVHGMIHVLFACYGAGWPQYDNFKRLGNNPKEIASRPTIGKLPQALLAHPDGGALAVLGHVDRAWAHSFHSDNGAPQTQGFRDIMGRLMRGDRLGQATDQFNLRWATLSTELAETLNQMNLGLRLAPDQLGKQWVARDDARNYVVFGDPAVRLRIEDISALTVNS